MLRDVLEGFRSQPGRVGLSFLAVAIGIMALTVLLAILGGLRQRAQQMVGELGGNVIAVVPVNREIRSEDKQRLGPADVRILTENLAGCRVSTMRRYETPAEGTDRQVSVVHTDANLADARGWTVSAGRFLDAADIARGERHAVISEALRQTWRKKPGDVVTLGGMPFVVAGVIRMGSASVEGGAGDSRLFAGDRVVFVPSSVACPWQAERREDDRLFDAIFIKVPDGQEIGKTVARAQGLLGRPGTDIAAYSWITPDVILAGVRRLQRTMRLAGGSIAFLCLVLGGTTLMSLMVANVRDRVAEIGLRRALGATPADIAALFVFEAAGVTVAAAFAGMLGAGLLLWFMGRQLQTPLAVDWMVVVVPIVLSAGLGAAFSYWPARMASRVSPAEALRND